MTDRPAITIRPIRADDYAEIVSVWHAAGLSTRPAGRDAEGAFRRQLPHFESTYLVAEDTGRIVGVVLGTHDQRKGWINRLAVHPDYRRQGIARRLIAACEEALHAQGIEIVVALVESDNVTSAAAFRAIGYSDDIPVRYFRKLRRPGV